MHSNLDSLPISEATWSRLVTANKRAVDAGWAEPGVFATGIGNEYGRGPLPRLSLMAEGDDATAQDAIIVMDERYCGAYEEDDDPPERFPEPEESIGIHTFFTALVIWIRTSIVSNSCAWQCGRCETAQVSPIRSE